MPRCCTKHCRTPLFCFDDFDSTNVYADDYYDWWVRGGDLEEFDSPGMREAVEAEIQRGTPYVVMDYPFGRDHSRFRDAIDLSVWVETPLDVAMARRILRDFMPQAGMPAAKQLERLKEDLSHYLVKSRHVYLDARHKHTADLELDGWKLWKSYGTESSRLSTVAELATDNSD